MKIIEKYIAIFYISLRSYNVFFIDIIGKNLIYVIRVVIIMTLFKAVYKMGGAVHTQYSLAEVGWGLIFVQSLVTARTSVANQISEEIKSGNIANHLLNPISYLGYKFIDNITQFTYNLFINLCIGILLGFLMIGKFDLTLYGTLGGIVLLVGAMLLQYHAFLIIGLFSFYIEDNDGLRMIYNFLDRLFGGNILPIPFFPDLLQKIIYLSPFAYTGYTAGLIFAKFDSGRFLHFFLVQSIWVIIYISLSILIYGNAKKKLEVNGG